MKQDRFQPDPAANPYAAALLALFNKDWEVAVSIVEAYPYPRLTGEWFKCLHILIIATHALGLCNESERHLRVHQDAARLRPWYSHHTVALADLYVRRLGETEKALSLLDKVQTDDPWLLRQIESVRLIAKAHNHPDQFDEQLSFLSNYTDVGPEADLVSCMIAKATVEEPLINLKELLKDLKTRSTDRHQKCLDIFLMDTDARLDKLRGKPWPFQKHVDAMAEIRQRYSGD